MASRLPLKPAANNAAAHLAAPAATHTRNDSSAVAAWCEGGAWRIGVPAADHQALAEVLAAACAVPCWTTARARAWALLLSAPLDAKAIAAIGEIVVDNDLDPFELTPLFAAAAWTSPAAVADLFPAAVPDCALVLCGPHAEPRAVLGLRSRNAQHRWSSANALRMLGLLQGVPLQTAKIAAALKVERDKDCRELLEEVLLIAKGNRPAGGAPL